VKGLRSAGAAIFCSRKPIPDIDLNMTCRARTRIRHRQGQGQVARIGHCV